MRRIISTILTLFLFAGVSYSQIMQPKIKATQALEADLYFIYRGDTIDFDSFVTVYNGASPSTVDVENILAGTVIKGFSYDSLLGNIYAPYVSPAFTSFGFASQASQVEVGTTISGSKSFEWAFSTAANVQANTLDIYDVTGTSYLATNISTTSPQSADIGSVQKTTATANYWRAYATNTNGVEFQSASEVVYWRWSRYWGFSDTIPSSSASVLALGNSELSTSNSKTINTTPPSEQYFTYAVPTSFGLPTITLNGFTADDAFTSQTVSITNASGGTTNYYIITSNNKFILEFTIVFD